MPSTWPQLFCWNNKAGQLIFFSLASTTTWTRLLERRVSWLTRHSNRLCHLSFYPKQPWAEMGKGDWALLFVIRYSRLGWKFVRVNSLSAGTVRNYPKLHWAGMGRRNSTSSVIRSVATSEDKNMHNMKMIKKNIFSLPCIHRCIWPHSSMRPEILFAMVSTRPSVIKEH